MKHLVYRRKCGQSPYKIFLDTSRHLQANFDFDLSTENTGLCNYYATKVELLDLGEMYRVELRLIDISPEEIKVFVTDRFIRFEAQIDELSFNKHFNFLETVDPSQIEGRSEDNSLIVDIYKKR